MTREIENFVFHQFDDQPWADKCSVRNLELYRRASKKVARFRFSTIPDVYCLSKTKTHTTFDLSVLFEVDRASGVYMFAQCCKDLHKLDERIFCDASDISVVETILQFHFDDTALSLQVRGSQVANAPVCLPTYDIPRRDRVYKSLFAKCGTSRDTRAFLKRRGLDPSKLVNGKKWFRTWPGYSFPNATIRSEQPDLPCEAPKGLILAALSPSEEVTAFQVCAKSERGGGGRKNAKGYHTVGAVHSHPCYLLPSGERPLHVWLPVRYRKRAARERVIGICEGGLKSAVVAAQLGQIMIGTFSGVNDLAFVRRTLVDYITRLERHTLQRPPLSTRIVLYPDAGVCVNEGVCCAVFAAMAAVHAAGYEVSVAWWQQRCKDDTHWVCSVCHHPCPLPSRGNQSGSGGGPNQEEEDEAAAEAEAEAAEEGPGCACGHRQSCHSRVWVGEAHPSAASIAAHRRHLATCDVDDLVLSAARNYQYIVRLISPHHLFRLCSPQVRKALVQPKRAPCGGGGGGGSSSNRRSRGRKRSGGKRRQDAALWPFARTEEVEAAAQAAQAALRAEAAAALSAAASLGRDGGDAMAQPHEVEADGAGGGSSGNGNGGGNASVNISGSGEGTSSSKLNALLQPFSETARWADMVDSGSRGSSSSGSSGGGSGSSDSGSGDGSGSRNNGSGGGSGSGTPLQPSVCADVVTRSEQPHTSAADTGLLPPRGRALHCSTVVLPWPPLALVYHTLLAGGALRPSFPLRLPRPLTAQPSLQSVGPLQLDILSHAHTALVTARLFPPPPPSLRHAIPPHTHLMLSACASSPEHATTALSLATAKLLQDCGFLRRRRATAKILREQPQFAPAFTPTDARAAAASNLLPSAASLVHHYWFYAAPAAIVAHCVASHGWVPPPPPSGQRQLGGNYSHGHSPPLTHPGVGLGTVPHSSFAPPQSPQQPQQQQHVPHSRPAAAGAYEARPVLFSDLMRRRRQQQNRHRRHSPASVGSGAGRRRHRSDCRGESRSESSSSAGGSATHPSPSSPLAVVASSPPSHLFPQLSPRGAQQSEQLREPLSPPPNGVQLALLPQQEQGPSSATPVAPAAAAAAAAAAVTALAAAAAAATTDVPCPGTGVAAIAAAAKQQPKGHTPAAATAANTAYAAPNSNGAATSREWWVDDSDSDSVGEEMFYADYQSSGDDRDDDAELQAWSAVLAYGTGGATSPGE